MNGKRLKEEIIFLRRNQMAFRGSIATTLVTHSNLENKKLSSSLSDRRSQVCSMKNGSSSLSLNCLNQLLFSIWAAWPLNLMITPKREPISTANSTPSLHNWETNYQLKKLHLKSRPLPQRRKLNSVSRRSLKISTSIWVSISLRRSMRTLFKSTTW